MPTEISMGFGQFSADARGRLNIALQRTWIDPQRPGVQYFAAHVNNQARIMSAPAPVTNAQSLTYEDWLTVDSAVESVARRRLAIVADMRAAGLDIDIGGLGTTVAIYQRRTRRNAAKIDMSPTTESPEDRSNYEPDGVPVPIVHAGFRLNIRETAGRTYLETDNIEDATLEVVDTLEQLFLGTAGTITFGGYTLYGFYNHPRRITLAVGDWTALTGDQVIQRIALMIQAAQSKNVEGPYALYVPSDYSAILGLDYKAESDRSLLERILALPEIAGVKVLDAMRSKEPLLVSWASRLNRIAIGQDIIPIQWATMGPLETEYKVMAAIVPQLRTRYNDRDANHWTGYVHGTVS